MPSEFIKLGDRRINTRAITTVAEEADGGVIVHYERGGVEVLKGDDAQALLEWADGLLVATPKTDRMKHERQKALEKSKHEEEAAAKAEEKARARQDRADERADEKAHAKEDAGKADAEATAGAKQDAAHAQPHAPGAAHEAPKTAGKKTT